MKGQGQLHKDVDIVSYVLKNKSTLGRTWDGGHMGRKEMKVSEFNIPLQCDKSQSLGVRNHLNEVSSSKLTKERLIRAIKNSL